MCIADSNAHGLTETFRGLRSAMFQKLLRKLWIKLNYCHRFLALGG